jgi:hypothetical protein
VWSCGVVVDTPGFDDPASLGEIGEQVLVGAVVAGHQAGRSTPFDNAVELASNADA